MPLFVANDLDQMVLSTVEGNGTLYTFQERYDAINEAVRIINLHTGYLHTSITFASIAGRSIYNTPSGILIPLRLEFNGRYLHPSGVDMLNHSYPEWMKDTTTSLGSPVARWARWGLTKLVVHPSDGVGGQSMVLYGIDEPPLLVNPTDVIPMNDEMADEIKDYAGHILPMKEGGAIFSAASLYYQEFIRKRKLTARWKQMTWPSYFVDMQVQK